MRRVERAARAATASTAALRRPLLPARGRGLQQRPSSASAPGISALTRTAVHDDRAVADELDLRLAREVKSRIAAPASARLAQQHVDLALGADVDAARRVEAEHRLEARREPAGERELLAVAADSRRAWRCRARVDRQLARSRRRPAGARRRMVDRPPAARRGCTAAPRCSRRSAAAAAAPSRGRPGTSTMPARIASYGMAGLKRLGRRRRSRRRRLALAGQLVEQRVLALALERGDAEDLAGAQLERRPRGRPRPRVPRTSSTAPRRAAPRRPAPSVRRRGGRGLGRATVGRASSSTIFSSSPACGTSVPTVRPSRSTVARSHGAVTSARR